MPYKGEFTPIYNWNDLVAMKQYGTRTISISGKDEDKVLSYIPKFTGKNWHTFELKMITYLETNGLYGHIIDVNNPKAIIKPTYEYIKPVKKEKQMDEDFANQTNIWDKCDKEMKEKITNWFIDDGKVQGYIKMCLKETMKHLFQDEARGTWAKLQSTYKKTGWTHTYAKWQELH